MRSSHSPARTRATFDDPNLVSHAGLVPLVRLAESVDLAGMADDLVRLGGPRGAHAGAKITTIVAGMAAGVAGMAAGADSISDLDLLREGGMDRLFTGIRAPSTIGAFLRWFTIGHNAQLENLLAGVLTRLAERTGLLPGVDQLAFLDLDSKITRVYGRQKHGAAYGYTKTLGLNFLAATLATEQAAPVITGTRLRGGNADTRRQATSFARTQLRPARACGAGNKLLVRMDSGYYVGELIAEIAASGAWFSVTAPQRKPIRAAIAAINEAAWTPITYARPVRDPDTGAVITRAEIAETSYTAFTNPTLNPGQKTTGRLIPVHRYHAFFTKSPADPVTADAQHRGRAGAIEHVFADLNSAALAHFPSGHFAANAAWLTLAALAHNLTRAIGVLAGGRHARARTTTLRHRLIGVAARITRSARTLTLHLPTHWPWHRTWQRLFSNTHRAPPPTT